MLLHSYVGAPIGAVCYLVGDETSGEALAIDAPGGAACWAAETAKRLGLRLGLLVLTHGHWDHIIDAAAFQSVLGAKVAIHAADAPLVRQPSTAPFELPLTVAPCEPDRLLFEGEALAIGSLQALVLETPGHTPGCVCLHLPTAEALFSGDTLFAAGMGRTDLPGGDEQRIAQSLGRLAALPSHTRVYPGHGPATTIAAERWLANYLNA